MNCFCCGHCCCAVVMVLDTALVMVTVIVIVMDMVIDMVMVSIIDTATVWLLLCSRLRRCL